MAQDPPETLDPARMDDSYEASVINQIFDGLLAFDANLNTIPSVAKSWEISTDGRTYTFDLKDGVRFHDGTEVTADDVLYSLSRVFRLDPEESVLAREYLSHIEGVEAFADGLSDHIDGLEELSPHRIRITLDKPYASFLSVLASELSRIVPRHYVEQVGNDAFARHPVGCGPFRFAEWSSGDRIVLTRFDDYHLGHAHLDSLVFELPDEGGLPTGSVREDAIERFLEGELSAVEVTPEHVLRFQRRKDLRLLSRQELSLTYIALNLSRPPFDDVRIRRAFALALDRRKLADMQNGRIQPTGILPPGLPGYSPEPKVDPHDPDEARRLLAEAGYPRGEGLPPIVHVSSRRSSGERKIQEEMRRQLAEVGFDFRTEHMDWLEFSDASTYLRYEAFSITWVADIPDPDSFLMPLFHRGGPINYYGYANAQVDDLLERGSASRSNGSRWEMYRQAEEIILHDMPVVPLFHTVVTVAIQPQVQSVSVSPLGTSNLALDKVWLNPATGASPPTLVEASR
jgi:peptide/nickel transport system substrate-binding protein/oligopeptide transport system substrate-binding protein